MASSERETTGIRDRFRSGYSTIRHQLRNYAYGLIGYRLRGRYRAAVRRLLDIYDRLHFYRTFKVPKEIRQSPEYEQICSRCLAMTSTREGLEALRSPEGYRHLRRYQIYSLTEHTSCPLCAFIGGGNGGYSLTTIPARSMVHFTSESRYSSPQVPADPSADFLDGKFDKALIQYCSDESLRTILPKMVQKFVTRKSLLQERERPYVHTRGPGREPARKPLYISAVEGDPASAHLKNQSPFDDFAGEKVFQKLRIWLFDCYLLHKECRSRMPKLPKRIVDVGTSSESQIKIQTNSANTCRAYIALSYCWGRSMAASVTTSKNIRDRMKSVDMSALPRTIQDAVRVTRGIGLQYLWVDALCILQDDEDDKAAEIANMGLIYKDATVTIEVADAEDSRQGFLNVDLTNRQRLICQVPLLLPDGTYGIISLSEGDLSFENSDALGTRGWAFQEHILSARSILYKDGNIMVHCRSRPRSNIIFPGGLVHLPARFRSLESGHKDLSVLSYLSTKDWYSPTSSRVQSAIISSWEEVVTEYSRRCFTFPEDRLPALSGLAKEFARVTGDTYISGMWQSQLLRQLCWESGRRQNPDAPSYDAIQISGPSWSWVQFYDTEGVSYSHLGFQGNGPFRYHGHPLCAEIVEYNIVLDRKADHFGRVSSGSLTIRGKTVGIMELEGAGGMRSILKSLDRPATAERDNFTCLNQQANTESDNITCLLIGFRADSVKSSIWEARTSYIALMISPATSGTFKRIGLLNNAYSANERNLWDEAQTRTITIT